MPLPPCAVPAKSAAAPTAFAGVKVLPGAAEPLGPTLVERTAPGRGTVNFALFSAAADSVTLVLADPGSREPAFEAPLARAGGGVWAAALGGLPLAGVGYAFRVSGPPSPTTRWAPEALLLDPRAPLVDGRVAFGVRDERETFVPGVGSRFWGAFDFASPPYDWGADAPPAIPDGKLVIYEVGVRPFTAGGGWEGCTPHERGTYAGLAARAQYLADLGINAVELLPIFEYDELEFQIRPNPRDHMVNVWGYSHVSFFAPMARFGSGCGVAAPDAPGARAAAAARELKDAVKALHAAGIKVILDVVYNHTAEVDDIIPYTLSWRGIDAGTYYMQDPGAPTPLVNMTGCGNTVNANHPVVSSLILDSLRHWVTEYHVDGFRFDLASALTRDGTGAPIGAPPLIEAIAKDPVLSQKILIAEPWDCGGLYQVGSFPNWDVWGEWNGKFRDDVRRFVRGDAGAKRGLATRLAGSADLYATGARRPDQQVNFVIAHDGFSLGDWVAYSAKHNEANGEGGRDGSDDNLSWNCGVEGPTADPAVLSLRGSVARSAMLALFLAAGTPMIVAGDEYLSTHGGNNNWYGHDDATSRFDWAAAVGDAAGFRRFMTELIALRMAHPLLGGTHFWGGGDVVWHEGAWDDDSSRFLAFELRPRGEGERLFAAFNAHGHGVAAALPPGRWARLVDTHLPPPRDITPGGNAGITGAAYDMAPHSAILLESRGG